MTAIPPAGRDAPQCAHLRVVYRTEQVEHDFGPLTDAPSNGPHIPPHGVAKLTRGWWECDFGCGTRFVPNLPSVASPAAAAPRPAGPTPEGEQAEVDCICPNCRLLIFEREMPKVVALRAIWRTRAADERERGPTLSPRQVDRIAEAYAEEDWDSLDFEALVTSHRALQAGEDEYAALTEKLSGILTRTANALKGEPDELSAHSWHDLPEVAESLRAALASARAARSPSPTAEARP